MTCRLLPGFAPLLLPLLAACQTLDLDYPREDSVAIVDGNPTMVHELFPAMQRAGEGESGFHMLADGVGAFVARVYLVRAAERSLDLQYYMINADDTGRLLVGELLDAADRGVRVRILLDDIYAAPNDRAIATLDAHPHIEVRLFNPWTRRSGVVGRAVDFLLNPGRLNRRMHNKLFAADNHAVIVGGRNIGDEYFDLKTQMNFRDLDVLGIGPVAAEASQSFDDYWNSKWAVPAAALTEQDPTEADMRAAREALGAHRERLADSRYVQALEGSQLAQQLDARTLPLEFGKARVLVDDPSKMEAEAGDRAGFLIEELQQSTTDTSHELLVSSPYFVPGKAGVEVLTGLAGKGVAISVMTNSLAANDVAVVHSGYARYRAPLLRGGVRLHELRVTSELSSRRKNRRRFGSEYVSLHAKYLIIDQRKLFVGSINFDPRSIERNTEIGILIESEALAAQLRRIYRLATGKSLSYEVTLRDGPDAQNDALIWTGENLDGELRFTHEPDTSRWKRFSAWFLGLLPFLESQI
ncbi:MAG TPA: phospholipase D family protein [Steroidobacteraceae bacterium]|nr:phospholipase D family protein [Steroidobacteraceae bacterium]HNS28373.1 phospholipase D family protein [Steroidobacteraceae bacterium]